MGYLQCSAYSKSGKEGMGTARCSMQMAWPHAYAWAEQIEIAYRPTAYE